MEKLVIYLTTYSVNSLFGVKALLNGAVANGIKVEVFFDGTSILAITKQFYDKYPKQDTDNEYARAKIDIWKKGYQLDWLESLKDAKKMGLVKVRICGVCKEAFEKIYGPLEFLDIVDETINPAIFLAELREEKDVLVMTV